MPLGSRVGCVKLAQSRPITIAHVVKTKRYPTEYEVYLHKDWGMHEFKNSTCLEHNFYVARVLCTRDMQEIVLNVSRCVVYFFLFGYCFRRSGVKIFSVSLSRDSGDFNSLLKARLKIADNCFT